MRRRTVRENDAESRSETSPVEKVQMRRSQEANGQHKSPRLIRQDEERENVIQRKDADRETEEEERKKTREKEEERKKRRERRGDTEDRDGGRSCYQPGRL